MPNKAVEEMFEKKSTKSYDDFNRKLSPISENLYFLMRLILRDWPEEAHVLCVGVGTGEDILSIAKHFPKWKFTGIDPSPSMLERCRDKIKEAGLSDRCELQQTYLSDFKANKSFDAVFCLFVMHFIKDLKERAEMFSDMFEKLKPEGILISSEISFDTESDLFPLIFENWKSLQSFGGSPEENLNNLESTLKEHLRILSPERTKQMIESQGFNTCVPFFQSLMIHGFYALKGKK